MELHVTVNSRLACTVLRLATYIHPPTTERVDPKIPMPTRSISNRMTARPEVSYLGSLRAVVLCVVRFFISLISPVLLFSVFYFYFSRCHQRYHSSTQVSVANRKCPSRQVKTSKFLLSLLLLFPSLLSLVFLCILCCSRLCCSQVMQSSQDSLTVEDSDTQSLTASVTDYPIEHGRRYHRYHEGGMFLFDWVAGSPQVDFD